MQKIDTVFFDAGNTLLQTATDESQTFARLAAETGIQLDVEVVRAQLPRMYQLYERLYRQDESFWQDEQRARAIWLQMYEYLGSLLAIPAELRPLLSQKVYTYYLSAKAWQLFDDAPQTLRALRDQDIKMGIISNCESTLVGIISGLGLSDFFGSVLVSADVGMHKPMPQMFELALSRLDALPENSLHVGDVISADVMGASAVGITPVLIDRDRQHSQIEGHHIQDLRQLLKIVGSSRS